MSYMSENINTLNDINTNIDSRIIEKKSPNSIKFKEWCERRRV